MSNKSRFHKQLKIYLFVTIFCAIFSLIYELFAHQVYSVFMIGLFVIPLILGVIPACVRLKNPRLRTNNWWQHTLQHFGVVTLTIGAALQGVVEIYGTTNQFIIYYLLIGLGLLIFSGMIWWTELRYNCNHLK